MRLVDCRASRPESFESLLLQRVTEIRRSLQFSLPSAVRLGLGSLRDARLVFDASSVSAHGWDDQLPAVLELAGAHGVAAVVAAALGSRPEDKVNGRVSVDRVLDFCALTDIVAACPNSSGSHHAQALRLLQCADGWVGVSIPSPFHQEMLDRAMSTEGGEAGEAWCGSNTRLVVAERLQSWRLSATPNLSPSEIRSDPHSLARRSWSRRHDRWLGPPPLRVRTEYAANGQVASPRKALLDLHVVELGGGWAAAYAGRLLAGLGARVTRVEPPDRMRVAGGCRCAAWALNEGKSVVQFDLGADRGIDMFTDLVESADVVIENMSPRVMPNFRLDFDRLLRSNPRIIQISMPAFGATGPWRNWTAFGPGVELASGLAWAGRERSPRLRPVPYLDFVSGAYSAAAALLACAGARGTRGLHLELAMRDVAVQSLRDGSVIPVEAQFQKTTPSTLTSESALCQPALTSPIGLCAATERHAESNGGKRRFAGAAS